MRVKILSCGREEEVSQSKGSRLIAMGAAVEIKAKKPVPPPVTLEVQNSVIGAKAKAL